MNRFARTAKFVVLLLAAWGLAHAGQAKCYTRGLRCWPSGGTLRPQPILVLDGLAQSQEIIHALGATYQAYLQAGKERVVLDVQDKLVGQYGVSQAVLKPRRPLTVGQRYELIIRGKGAGSGNLLEQANGPYRANVVYTVVAGTDQTPPAWKAAPREHAKHYEEMGCGPEVYVDFTAAVLDESACLIKATVRDLDSGQASAYYLPPDAAGLVSVGHGMCTGAFRLENGRRYTVAFTLLDAAGNTTPWQGPALAFTRPEKRG
ncbi:hypothetical protein GCM10027048_18670 [Hymenobacter coalescens]